MEEPFTVSDDGVGVAPSDVVPDEVGMALDKLSIDVVDLITLDAGREVVANVEDCSTTVLDDGTTPTPVGDIEDNTED